MVSWTDLLPSSRARSRRGRGGRRRSAERAVPARVAPARDQDVEAQAQPQEAPGWAQRSISEEGGIVHETLSAVSPFVLHRHLNGQDLIPTQISLSATDVHIDGRWIRTRPTVQVEGGSYTLDGARQLRAALDDLLTLADDTSVALG